MKQVSPTTQGIISEQQEQLLICMELGASGGSTHCCTGLRLLSRWSGVPCSQQSLIPLRL